jgi:uncharacterized protein YjbI with pentapeptide repeats
MSRWFDPINIAVAIVLAAAVIFGAWWLWWRLPKRQVDRLRLTIRDPKARADVEDNYRKTIGQLLGGAAVLIGAALAYMQFTQQQQTSQHQFSLQQQASRDLLISNLISKGFEQLGSDKIIVRLGGIYALEGVMNTSEEYHQPVLEALSAFVRDGTRTFTGDGPPATEIQAALTVIGRRKATGFRRAVGLGLEVETDNLDLSRAHIPRAYLGQGYLRDAYLLETNLEGAILVQANLGNARLMGANLSGAFLIGARLNDADLTGAHLTSAHLYDANLTGAIPNNASLTGARLNDADLSGAAITQAQLDQACGTGVKLDPGLTIKPCQ